MDNKLPEKIYAWNYCGSFNTGLGLPVVDMGDTPWAIYTRSQPKYKRVDLDKEKIADPVTKDHLSYSKIYNEALDVIKSKYGDLWVVIEK